MTPLQQFIEAHPRLFVLTGAGCSTDSGIPDYRDRDGQWKRPPPVNYAAFMHEPATRQRYWARSMVGWRRFGNALPNIAHHALVALERHGRIELLVTQNVDRLHQRAGSERVLDLHGRLDEVRCMNCDWRLARHAFQRLLVERNPAWAQLDAADAPDGDADLEGHDFASFGVPPCPHCGGIVKPDVVFFGETVPRERVEAATRAWQDADAVLVVGSSLMVYSGYRFVDAAARAGKPVAAVTLGRTRADALLTLKVDAPCHEALAFLQTDKRPETALRE
ncbi:NAD-dependent protein deacetylase [Rhodanobacter sp. B2A1Ga4]|uniref:NAD-dependent protein deacetylase n=1 Tax=Rhodanobacter sp. B2A1Ga4 TaxID=2778647 RepID=UPI001B394740|nr:NAD-dependent protein deacetylase [Rhodanobacter sp. B2A1Ga4]MBQ4853914.1 NAD-dependent protein deacetylase [Rhodanobacter sp. B2A1Ga4]